MKNPLESSEKLANHRRQIDSARAGDAFAISYVRAFVDDLQDAPLDEVLAVASVLGDRRAKELRDRAAQN